MVICDIGKCTGCMACMNICPFGAIKPAESDTYKTIPVVDDNLCRDCGLCKKICPEANGTLYHASFKCYAAWKKDGADTKNCASAGVAAAFGEYITDNGGVVFGAGYKDGRVCHISVSDKGSAEALKGSKYVQSDIGFSYREAKSYLEDGRCVLFTGTPCQIAGFRNFLGKDYDNLVTVDLVCHGVPPQRFLQDYLRELNVMSKECEVRFRGEEDHVFKVSNGDGVVYKEGAVTNVYYRAYYNKILMRDNCNSCRYATEKNRPADISLGDFWGIDKSTIAPSANGKISLVLLNTKKGKAFFEKVNLPSQPREIAEAVCGNAQLKAPCPRGGDTDLFLKHYNLGFTKAVNKTCVRKNIRQNKRNLMKFKIKELIKKGLKL